MPEKENEERLQLKTDESGAVVLTDDGRPVFVWPDGREEGVDVPGMYEKIKSLGRENQKYREEGKGLNPSLPCSFVKQGFKRRLCACEAITC